MAMGPINYAVDVGNPIQSFMSGVGQMQGLQMNDQAMAMREQQMQAMKQQQEQQAAAAERAKAFQAQFGTLLSNPELGGEKIGQFMAQFPEYSKEITTSFGALSDERKAKGVRFAGEVYTLLDGGNVEMARERLQERLTAAQNSGDNATVASMKTAMMMLDNDPTGGTAKNFARFMGNAMAGGDFESMIGASGAFKGNSMDAQAYNILTSGDPSSPEYAAAYNYASQPRFDMKSGTQITPNMSAFRRPGSTAGDMGGNGGGVTVQDLPMSASERAALVAETTATLDLIESLRNDPGLDANLGFQSLVPNMPGGAAADAMAKIKQIVGKSFMQAFQTLKGGGQITETEGAAATNAISRMQAVLDERGSKEAFLEALREFEGAVKAGSQKLQMNGGANKPKASPQAPGGAPASKPRSYAPFVATPKGQ